MRFLLYNIRYATGPKLHKSASFTSKNLERISTFMRELEPDLVGLIEVDHGSYRSGGKNQAELLAKALGHYHSHEIKYQHGSFWRQVPVLKKQGNAFLTRDRIRDETFHFFKHGMKRLVIELELQHVVIFLVHLAMGARARHQQLAALYDLVKQTKLPCVVAGDFNMLWGVHEIDMFLSATGLQNANVERLPTYPSTRPHRNLDFFLHSKDIKVWNFQIPQVTFSDHLPLLVDFDVKIEQEHRKSRRPQHCSCLEKAYNLSTEAHSQYG